MSVRPSGRTLWVLSTVSGLTVYVLTHLLVAEGANRTVVVFIVASVVAFVLSDGDREPTIVLDSAKTVPSMEVHARLELGRVVRVLRTKSTSGSTAGSDLVFVPESLLGTPEAYVVLAHELAHLKSRDAQWNRSVLVASGILIPNLVLALGASPLVLLGAVFGTLLFHILLNWGIELKADVFAAKWGTAKGLYTKADCIRRRQKASTGMSLTHPPRWLRVRVVQII